MAASISPLLPLSTLPTSIASDENDKIPPTIQSSNVEALFETIDQVSGDFLTVTNVSTAGFT